jgi:hypothetical protein
MTNGMPILSGVLLPCEWQFQKHNTIGARYRPFAIHYSYACCSSGVEDGNSLPNLQALLALSPTPRHRVTNASHCANLDILDLLGEYGFYSRSVISKQPLTRALLDKYPQRFRPPSERAPPLVPRRSSKSVFKRKKKIRKLPSNLLAPFQANPGLNRQRSRETLRLAD